MISPGLDQFVVPVVFDATGFIGDLREIALAEGIQAEFLPGPLGAGSLDHAAPPVEPRVPPDEIAEGRPGHLPLGILDSGLSEKLIDRLESRVSAKEVRVQQIPNGDFVGSRDGSGVPRDLVELAAQVAKSGHDVTSKPPAGG